MDKKKRQSVSVMIGGVHSYFTRQMIKGIEKAAREEDMNTYFFLRIHTKPFFRSVLGDFINNMYDYQFNTVHEYTRISGTDGTIIGYGTIGFHLNRDEPTVFASKYNDHPLVIVTEKVDLPGCYNIIADNYHGMYDLVTHLIEVDHCKRILFMRGPRSNTDANERYQGYLDAMAAHGKTVTESMVGQGDFSGNVDKEIERVLDANPDACTFVFSNDEMASSCYRVCERRGLRVGVDLRVAGFDGGEFSEQLIPPLTTVFQDSYGMGMQAGFNMAKILRGEAVPETRFPVSVVPRESCGCTPAAKKEDAQSQYSAEKIKQFRYQAAKREQELLEYQGKSWFIPMMARDLNDCVANETEYCRQVMEKLKLLKVNAAYLFLLDHSISYDGKTEWSCPDNLYLASYCRNGESFSYQTYDRPRVTPENGIAQLTDDGDNHQFMCFLLFSGERQYGLLACDVPTDELSFFYVVSLQLGLSLEYLELNKVQEMHRRQLAQDMEAIRAKNKELDMLAGYDQLSGLLNLRGLTDSVKALCRESVSLPAYLLYCDLDHLKQINDYFGHPEGNFAITTCSSILRSCIRETDTLARIGGDEFLCLVLSDEPAFPDLFRSRLTEACAKVNESSGKPFYVGLSVGIQPFTLTCYEDFQAAVKEADKHLYVAKSHRRADVRKEIN